MDKTGVAPLTLRHSANKYSCMGAFCAVRTIWGSSQSQWYHNYRAFWGRINEMNPRDTKACQAEKCKSNDNANGVPGKGGSSGTMIMDAACAASNTRYHQNASPLNEARKNTENAVELGSKPGIRVAYAKPCLN